MTLLFFHRRCHTFVYTTHTFYLSRLNSLTATTAQGLAGFFFVFWDCAPLVTLSAAECTKLELVFNLHSFYTCPITTLANVIVAILNLAVIYR